MYTKNEEELQALGERLGHLLAKNDVLILTGELGAGKTTFTKGLAKGLQISQMIKSPTYTIVREYEGRLPLYHLDVYRIEGDADSIDLDEFIFGGGVTVIEWGNLLGDALPDAYLELEILKEADGRRLNFQAKGLRAEKLLEELNMEYELLIREAEPKDAAELVAFLNRVSLETDFTSLDGDGILLTSEEMEIFLNKQASSDNQITLLAFLNGKIAGIVNITADQRKRVRHIGDLFIVIGKRYWNNGLGSLLLEEAIEWAQASGILRRLQLTVQTRNQAAVHLYQKHGFVIEGSQERGAYIEEGKFIDVYLMGKLID